MKLGSAQERCKQQEGRNVRGGCARGEASAPVEKRKRQRSSDAMAVGDAQVSKTGDAVSGSGHRGKDRKGNGDREGKRLKKEVDGGKGRIGKGREKGNVSGDRGDSAGVGG